MGLLSVQRRFLSVDCLFLSLWPGTRHATNIGHKFLQAVDECFPPNHCLYKIFKRNTLKLSYSCMPNVHQIITAHNKTILDKQIKASENPTKECNCRYKESCPLQGKCLTESVVYQATVTRKDNQQKETYVGLTEGPFKTRYNNHTSSFRNTNIQRN